MKQAAVAGGFTGCRIGVVVGVALGIGGAVYGPRLGFQTVAGIVLMLRALHGVAAAVIFVAANQATEGVVFVGVAAELRAAVAIGHFGKCAFGIVAICDVSSAAIVCADNSVYSDSHRLSSVRRIRASS